MTRDDVGALRYIYRKQNYNVQTLLPGSVTGGGGPWSPPAGTNAVAVSQALRPGVDKVTFIRADFDSLFGQFKTMTNRYTDHYVTNGVVRQQGIVRALTVPDIVFGAADLGVTLDGDPFVFFRTLASAGAFVNNDAINGTTGLPGPGQINPPLQIQFNKLGPFFQNIGGGGEENATIGFTWGHFDGTTNAPIIFPVGSSIQDLERRVLGSGGGSPWTIP